MGQSGFWDQAARYRAINCDRPFPDSTSQLQCLWAGEEKSPGLRNKGTSPAGPPAFPGFLVLVPPTHLSIFPWKRGFSGPAEKNAFPIFGRAASWSPLHEVVRGTPSRSKGKNELLGYLLLLGGKSENARSGWPPYVDWGMQGDLPALFLWSWVPKPACFLLSILQFSFSCAISRVHKVVLSRKEQGKMSMPSCPDQSPSPTELHIFIIH